MRAGSATFQVRSANNRNPVDQAYARGGNGALATAPALDGNRVGKNGDDFYWRIECGEPGISVDDVAVEEGDAGTVDAVFTVSLSRASSTTITVDYGTVDATALAATDYTATGGTLEFLPGELAKRVAVPVQGDLVPELDEYFALGLARASGAAIVDNIGIGTIRDDDAPPPGPRTCGGRDATIVGTDGPDHIVGTNGPDVIDGLGGDDEIEGLDGVDVICGGDGADRVSGGPGIDPPGLVPTDDIVFGGAGNDTLSGDSGNDTLHGEAGDDGLDGGTGHDVINGGDGTDSLLGRAGRDILRGDAGNRHP